jgi:hypothetical protein
MVGDHLHDLAPLTRGGKIPILLDKGLMRQKIGLGVVAMRIMTVRA